MNTTYTYWQDAFAAVGETLGDFVDDYDVEGLAAEVIQSWAAIDEDGTLRSNRVFYIAVHEIAAESYDELVEQLADLDDSTEFWALTEKYDTAARPMAEALEAAAGTLATAREAVAEAKKGAAAAAAQASADGWGVERIAATLGVNHLTVRRWLGRRP